MTSIQNRSRIAVTVPGKAAHTRLFPFNALGKVQAYVDELRAQGLKARAAQQSDAWEVRVRQKGYAPQNLTFQSLAAAEQFMLNVKAERSIGLFRDYTKARHTTFAHLLVRYLKEFKKKSAKVIAYKIESWLVDSGPASLRLLKEHRENSAAAGLKVRN